MGFPAPAMIVNNEQPSDRPLSVNFCCGKDGTLLHSSTCGLTIWLPAACELEHFNNRLYMALKDCQGFGSV